MNVPNLLRRIAAAASFVVSFLPGAPAGAAVVLNISGGELTGASGITVSGFTGTFSVEFLDSSCASIFSPCVQSSFAFSTSGDAEAASQALLDQVFLDSGLGNFDTDPELTFGCGNASNCGVFTPFAIFGTFARAVIANNRAPGTSAPPDAVATGADVPVDLDFSATGGAQQVWALWTAVPASQNVPEPATPALLAVAGAALVLSQRRRRRSL